MMIRSWLLPLILVFLAIGAVVLGVIDLPAASAANAGPIDFTMTDVHDQPVTLSTYRGKVVIVEVFATWCHYCNNERPALIDLQKRADEDKLPLQVIGIAVDPDKETVRQFVKNTGINYPVVFQDPTQMQPFGQITGYPTNFIINKRGEIAETIVGATDEATLNATLKKYLDEKYEE